MSLETWFVPLDSPLLERLRGHVAAAADATDLAERLRGETYFASDDDRKMVVFLAGKPEFRDESVLLLSGLRTDPPAYADRAAKLILEAGSVRDQWLADLAQAEIGTRFFTPLYLILAYASQAYARVVTGEVEVAHGPVPYDGPAVIADALGGPLPPESALFALRDPQATAAIATGLDALEFESLRAAAPAVLRDFYEDSFGSSQPLDGLIEDGIETLRDFYSECRDQGWGAFLRSG